MEMKRLNRPETVLLSDRSIACIRSITASTTAVLLGFVSHSAAIVHVVSAFVHEESRLTDDDELLSAIDRCLPGGVSIVGYAQSTEIVVDRTADTPTDLVYEAFSRFCHICTPIRALWAPMEEGLADVTLADTKLPVAYEVLPNRQLSKGTVTVQFELAETLRHTGDVDCAMYDRSLDRFAQMSKDPSIFIALGPTMLALNGQEMWSANKSVGDSNWTTIGDVWCSLEEDAKAAKKQLADLRFDRNRVRAVCHRRITGESLAASIHNCAPVVKVEKFDTPIVTIPLALQLSVVCPTDANLAEVREYCSQALNRAVSLVLRRIDGIRHPPPNGIRTRTFLPHSLGHLVTTAMLGDLDADEEGHRRAMHNMFCLPEGRPQFRRCNAFLFADQIQSPYLYSVHENCKLDSAISGRVSLVSGPYTYHHYTQDGLNDSGWGCAYRSLQTICSWLHLNGFTSVAVPTHERIQQSLVDVGDRPKSFVGSRNWIGSLELSYIIDNLLGMQCRIVTAANGGDMATKARELQAHFDTVGAPVMIGGGVLAHTILGVDFNDSTGEVRWLVLDPHYTGEENIRTIVQKGWCNWKTVSFWQTDAFYNMLLPQPPACI